jgi:putative transposase
MSVSRGFARIGADTAGAVGDDGGSSVPGAEGTAGGQPEERVPLRELMDDRLLDALLERSRDEAGGLRLTGAGSMLGELVAAVRERALAAELAAHLGYDRHEVAGRGSGNSRNGSKPVIAPLIGLMEVKLPEGRLEFCLRLALQAAAQVSESISS